MVGPGGRLASELVEKLTEKVAGCAKKLGKWQKENRSSSARKSWRGKAKI